MDCVYRELSDKPQQTYLEIVPALRRQWSTKPGICWESTDFRYSTEDRNSDFVNEFRGLPTKKVNGTVLLF